MSTTFAFRPRGGQHGIVVTINDLKDFSEFMDAGHIDDYIPLPEVDRETQKKRIAECNCNETEADNEYWETEDGDHGWCCGNCGKVNQWG